MEGSIEAVGGAGCGGLLDQGHRPFIRPGNDFRGAGCPVLFYVAERSGVE